MGRAEREKGRKGEAEVAAIFRGKGFDVRGLEAAGDHLVVCGKASGVTLHSEVKRQETARPWAWWEQAAADAPAGVPVVVTFRRSRSPWLSLILTDELATILGELESARRALEATRERIAELELELGGERRPIF